MGAFSPSSRCVWSGLHCDHWPTQCIIVRLRRAAGLGFVLFIRCQVCTRRTGSLDIFLS